MEDGRLSCAVVPEKSGELWVERVNERRACGLQKEPEPEPIMPKFTTEVYNQGG
jgi:hypothetical protein